jgi:hypothetical protein
MKNYKLFEVLKTLDKKEFRKYGELVRSPFFNKNKNVIKVLEAIEPYYPLFDNKKFLPETIYAKAFPGEKYNAASFKNYISDLYALVEEFLSITGLSKKQFEKELAMLTEFRHRELYGIYESKYGKMKDALEKREVKDEDYFLNMYNLVADYTWYAPVMKPNTSLENHQAYLDNLVYHSLIKMIKTYNLMLHEQNQTNIHYNLTMIDEALEFIKKREESLNPALLIFYKITLLLKTKDLKVYLELKELKEKHFNELDIASQRRFFIHLYDFCAYMVNFKGDDSYNKDMFGIYKEVLARKFMTADNLLYSDFMNIVKIACRVKEFEFAGSFIRDYKSSIPEEEKNNVLGFCRGVIEYSKGDYNNALNSFSRVNFTNFLYKVQVKIFLLQIYYKLNMFEEVLGMTDTFRHYIAKEENILKEHRESYGQFIKLVNRLVMALSSGDNREKEYAIHKLKTEAAAIPANPFRVRTWLIEELEKEGS